MTTVDATRPVTGGVDTHLDVNVAAALDAIGGLLGVAEFPTTPAGHRRLAEFLASFGTLTRVGVEGTGSYGAGLSRYLRSSGVEVVEVDRPNRQSRRPDRPTRRAARGNHQARESAHASPRLHHRRARRQGVAPRRTGGGVARRPANDNAVRPGTCVLGQARHLHRRRVRGRGGPVALSASQTDTSRPRPVLGASYGDARPRA